MYKNTIFYFMYSYYFEVSALEDVLNKHVKLF